jgi:hypothetical protein
MDWHLGEANDPKAGDENKLPNSSSFIKVSLQQTKTAKLLPS